MHYRFLIYAAVLILFVLCFVYGEATRNYRLVIWSTFAAVTIVLFLDLDRESRK